MSVKDSFYLFLSNKLGALFPCRSWSKKKKLQKLYEVGAERIDNELDIVKLMNSLRNLKIVIANSILNEETKR
jgi:hypothetical protein